MSAEQWVWRFLRYLPGNCDVCGNRRVVQVRQISDDRGLRPCSVVVPCPHCVSPNQLAANIDPAGGAAA
jgi:hypothetical protein